MKPIDPFTTLGKRAHYIPICCFYRDFSTNIQMTTDCLEAKRAGGCEFARHLIHRFTVHSAEACPTTPLITPHSHDDDEKETSTPLSKYVINFS